MKLVVLSRSRSIASTRRLVVAARARGHSARVIDPLELELHLDGVKAHLLLRRKRFELPDVVIPRIAPSIASYGLPVVEQFAVHGAVVLNAARAIGLSRNPARCLQRLSSNGIDIPSTLMARDASDMRALVGKVGGVPVVVKLLGALGRRVIVCESVQSLEAVLEAVLGLGHNIVLQEYVKKKARDVRVFVVGGKALAAVSRTPKTGRMSRTLAKLSRLEKLELTPPLREAAERTAALCELEVCAVDLLEVKQGPPKVSEVNASPSLPEMEAATGVDLAAAIIERAEAMVAARTAVASRS